MSSYDVSLTWTRADVALADVDVLAWLMTWTDDNLLCLLEMFV